MRYVLLQMTSFSFKPNANSAFASYHHCIINKILKQKTKMLRRKKITLLVLFSQNINVLKKFEKKGEIIFDMNENLSSESNSV